MRLLLVRHGLSSFNLDHRVQGRDDLSTLTGEGERQARAAGAALAELPIQLAYTSPLGRASRTAELLLDSHGGGLTAQRDEDLLEIDLHPWSGLTRDEVAERFPQAHRTWRERPHELELEHRDGRPYRPVPELLEQAERFLQRLRRDHADQQGTVLVVAHNAILRALIVRLLDLPAEAFRRLRIDNGSICVLNLSGAGQGSGAVQVELLNGTAHLGGDPLPPRSAGPRLLLVRHGETDWNRQGRFQGQIDIPLNDRGRAQAEAAARFLEPVTIHRAYTSSMARPRQTAEAILAGRPAVPLVSQGGLVEIGHGLWEGCLEQEISAGWPELLAAWKQAPHTVQMPEGETIHDVWGRSWANWERIAASLASEETALVVAHDAVNKTILCRLLGLAPADIWAIKQGNGAVTVIDYPRGAAGPPQVSCLNLTSHLGGVLDRTAAGAL